MKRKKDLESPVKPSLGTEGYSYTSSPHGNVLAIMVLHTMWSLMYVSFQASFFIEKLDLCISIVTTNTWCESTAGVL